MSLTFLKMPLSKHQISIFGHYFSVGSFSPFLCQQIKANPHSFPTCTDVQCHVMFELSLLNSLKGNSIPGKFLKSSQHFAFLVIGHLL